MRPTFPPPATVLKILIRRPFQLCLGGAALIAAALLQTGCTSPEPAGSSLNMREVTLPNGTRIRCEVMIRTEDMARGMMYRDSLALDRGMLFLHESPGNRPYWMRNVKIPLDIIWMDAEHRIVEISADTPPCLKEAENCPNYGGNAISSAVLELAGGGSARHGLKIGDRLVF
jgi:uncharacterized membrane protein (UPF0127 family)